VIVVKCRILTVNSQGTGGVKVEVRREEEGLGINLAMKRRFELEIERRCKMLQVMKVS
jgi:hypothetical protein